jgi:hypothetical protein
VINVVLVYAHHIGAYKGVSYIRQTSLQYHWTLVQTHAALPSLPPDDMRESQDLESCLILPNNIRTDLGKMKAND